MADERLPFLRGEIALAESFQDPRGVRSKPVSLPTRDQAKHRAHLIDQLDRLSETVAKRAADARDEAAHREVVVVQPAPGSTVPLAPLANEGEDVRVVGVDVETGSVLVDAATPELNALRKKIEAFGTASKLTAAGRPRNEPLVAPVDRIELASVEDRSRVPLEVLRALDAQWLEVSCRGGQYDPAGTKASRGQIARQLERLGSSVGIAASFVSTHSVVFYIKLDLAQLETLLARTDCVFEFGLAARKIRDWLYFERDEDAALDVDVKPPPPDAPTVVLLDTGIADWHPLLQPAVRSIDSVVPAIASGVDVDGHGTEMAGIALHLDGVGDAIENGEAEARHWLAAVKILTDESASADESARATWPPMTIDAVRRSEGTDGSRRIFAMAITADLDPVEPTMWSQAIEQLAWNDGQGRLIILSAGNARSGDVALLEGYPQLNLVQPIEDPAQAWNGLTVGACTWRRAMPPDDDLAEYVPVAVEGGVSPHTTSRPLDSDRVPNKPDVVLEGGNVAFDGKLSDATVPTLTTLTTGHRRERPLASLWATSEATARAAHLAASIWSADPELRPATVRGLIAHSASWTDAMLEQFEGKDDRLRICGYGLPDREFAMACTENRATVIVEDSLPNAVITHVLKDPPPKRPTTPKTKEKIERAAKLFRLPVPEDLLLASPDAEVELRVTLSYFAEVHAYRRTSLRGLDLRWDMQGPQETEAAFRYRVNKRVREQTEAMSTGKSFKWDIGPRRRQRGTVQSARWTGKASMLAGEKLIAVMPRLGWWNERAAFREKELPFSLIVTVATPGIDVYTPISIALETSIEITV